MKCQQGRYCKGGLQKGKGDGSDAYECPSGQYQPDTGQTACLNCPAGSYQNETDHQLSSCKLCGKGKTSDEGASSCTVCPAGSYTNGDVTGLYLRVIPVRTCTACGIGLFLESPTAAGHDNEEDCVNCVAGKTSIVGSAGCVPCVGGQYRTADTRGGACTNCPIGTFLEDAGTDASTHDDLNDCQVCDKGKISTVVASTSCTNCTAGKYNDAPSIVAADHATCAFCPSGQVSLEVGARSSAPCSPCEKGNGPNALSTVCGSCGPGEYNPSDTDGICIVCGAGQYNEAAVLDGAADHEACDNCPVGKFLSATSDPAQQNHPSFCKNCDPGKSAPPGSGACLVCPAGSFYEELALCKVCPRGKVIEDAGTDPALHLNVLSCADCAVGRFLEDGTAAEGTEATKHDDAIEDCLQCPEGYF